MSLSFALSVLTNGFNCDEAQPAETLAAQHARIEHAAVGRDQHRASASPLGPSKASPDAELTSYPADERGTELAILDAFGERARLARAGLILGPHEDVGRPPWWLYRTAAGGEILAPGPPELPLQHIGARDLARFALDAAATGHRGPFNVASRRGHDALPARGVCSVGQRCRHPLDVAGARLHHRARH